MKVEDIQNLVGRLDQFDEETKGFDLMDALSELRKIADGMAEALRGIPQGTSLMISVPTPLTRAQVEVLYASFCSTVNNMEAGLPPIDFRKILVAVLANFWLKEGEDYVEDPHHLCAPLISLSSHERDALMQARAEAMKIFHGG
jgi:hypothetical protein